MNYIESELIKYVIATIEEKPFYLKSLHNGEYVFVDNVMDATKTVKRSVASTLINYYRYDTKDSIDLVVIPVKISFELIDESNM